MSETWTPLPRFFGKSKDLENLMRCMTIMLCCFSLSACGPISSYMNDEPYATESYDNSAGTPLPDNNSGNALPPLIAPPGSQMTPLMPGQSGTQYRSDGLPALQPSQGVKLEQLFAQELRDPDLRMQRVENAVIGIRRDLDAVMPSIVRLVAVEQDIQSLVEQLEVLLREEPAPQRQSQFNQQPPPATYQPPPAAYQPPPSTSNQATAQPQSLWKPPTASAGTPSIPGQAVVQQLRLGEHKNKTRLVMDVTGKPAYRYDLDNTENILVIELPNTGWSGKQASAFAKAPLIASYNVYPIDGAAGSRLVILLKKPVKIITEDIIAPNQDSRNHRLVIDIAPQ